MFSAAYKTATQYTRAVIVSYVDAAGECHSAMGTYVVVNDQGWILTAFHLIEFHQKMIAAKHQWEQYEQQRQAIEQDTALNDRQRRKKLHFLGPPNKEWVKDFSFWWQHNTWRVDTAHFIKGADLALCHLEGFDAAGITGYPTFKDPSKAIDAGTSLCRLGFPFLEVKPTYTNGQFHLGALALTYFPNEGILTRIVEVTNDPQDGFIGYIETSSPGLRGQSGGPIFDAKGAVWGIQSHTGHLPLGFSPPVPGGKSGQVEHQFLNVGRGAHPATIVGLLTKFNVAHTISAH